MSLCSLVLLSFVVSSGLLRVVSAADLEVDLVFESGYHAPDGFPRQVILINGHFVGPTISATVGDTLHVHVTNQMIGGLSVHFHGLYQIDNQWYDGAAGISQCTIPRHNNFSYVIPLDQYGTYFYHAHGNHQITDGAIGILIIADPSGEYDDAVDVPMIAMSWAHVPGAMAAEANSYFGDDSVYGYSTESILINGKGYFECGSATDMGCTGSRLLEMNVTAGTQYRLRAVNGGTESLTYCLEGHPMTLIAADGAHMDPVEDVGCFSLTPGQRVDAIFKADAEASVYALSVSDGEVTGYAAVRYDGVHDEVSASEWMNITLFHPFEDVGVVEESVFTDSDASSSLPDVADVEFSVTSYGFDFDEYQYEFESAEPLLMDFYKGRTWEDEALFYHVALNDVVDFTFNNAMIMGQSMMHEDHGHPLHLHGGKFWVLSEGSMFFDPEMHELNTANPPMRDTATLPPMGHLVVRFEAVNPGVWMFHCHVPLHFSSGMVLFIVVGEAEDVAPPPDNFPSCLNHPSEGLESHPVCESSYAYSSCDPSHLIAWALVGILATTM